MKILTPADVDQPQLASTSTGQDFTTGDHLFMDVYTGLLRPGHAAGDDPSELDIQFPVVFAVASPGAAPGIAIADFHNPAEKPNEFRAAVANVSIAGFVDKTDPAIVHVLSARADLRSVRLLPTGFDIFAVVLAGKVKAQNSEIAGLGYQVTVLRRHPPKETLLPSINVGSPNWDGSYAHIGDPPAMAGAPQNS